MHFFHKTIGLMAVLCAIPVAHAATARPGVIPSAASRMPTMVVKTSSGTATTTTTTGTTTSTALLANAECIDAYSECIKGADACGENFEECTTKVLFHGKMPNCLSTLAQCSPAGVESLFGTSNVAALASGEVKNTYGEVTDYTYPTNGSVLGQMITAAAISNQYDTSTCVRRVTSCLRKDNVCGDEFELCTTNKEFRKQRVFCDSTLARCQTDGVIELLGSSNRTAVPTASSRIGEMIAEGAALAAVNAVSTCYKVIDQCVLGACAENPYKCYENSNQSVASIVDAINNGTEITTEMVDSVINGSSIRAYIKNSCLDTVGSNKYCYATFLGNGQMPTNAQLRDEDNQDEIFDAAYSSRMNDGMRAKIADLVNKFDTRAKQKCTETIKSCAMRVCGGGSGAACYSLVYGAGGVGSINASGTASKTGPYDEIKSGCAAIVNTDNNCKYAAANPNSTGTYSYTYINRDAFDILFPNADENKDPIGVVAALNSSLATSYNDAAIAQMRKQCANVARGCVVSMCGNDYVNCYRNRTDIVSGTYNTGETGLDKSMNKMGGVLDNNIVIGLCLDVVKNASACEEHLAIQKTKVTTDGLVSGWGAANSVRDGWLSANSTSVTKTTDENVKTGYCTASNATSNPNCNNYTQDTCGTVDENGCVYDIEVTEPFTEYALKTSATTVLQEVVADLEKEAQAKYNAKLTAEQHMCMAGNSGGILGSKDIGSTFMWAKLKTGRVPKDYTMNGLKQSAFTASNDLYGSFCRLRVTLQSDDRKIQSAIANKSWNTAYFAVGDAFTCGSWIPENELEELANAAADEATSNMRADQARLRTWTTILGTLGGGAGGLALGESIRKGKTLGGLTGFSGSDTKTVLTPKGSAEKCVESIGLAEECNKNTDDCMKKRQDYINEARKYAKDAGVDAVTRDVGVVSCAMDATTNRCYINQGNNTWSYQPTSTGDNIEKLKNACKKIATGDGNTTTEKASNHGWVTAVSTIALGTAGGLLVNKATQDIQDSELSAAQKEAYEDWMNKVGRHISCYIGGDEAGSFGDVISTSLE